MKQVHVPAALKCQFCDKKFKKRGQLEDHEAVHTGIPRYFCTVCDAKFKSQGNFHAHYRKLHPAAYQKEKLERQLKKFKA